MLGAITALMDNDTHKLGGSNVPPEPVSPVETPQVPEVDKGGRPTVMTAEVIETLRKAFMFGCTDVQACAYAGISPATLYNYQTAHPEFLEVKDGWKQHPLLKAKVTVYNKLNDVDTARWYLERKAKEEFGTRQEITGANGEDLIPKAIEEIERQNKTDYAKLAEQARRQMVASEQSVQNQGQTGADSNVPPQLPPNETPMAEGATPLQSDT